MSRFREGTTAVISSSPNADAMRCVKLYRTLNKTRSASDSN